MATETEIKDAIGAGFFVSDFLRTQGGINFDCFIQRVGEFAEFVGVGRFERGGTALTAMAQVRGSYSNAVDGAPGWLAPLMREYMDILNLPTNGLREDTLALYADYVTRGQRVKSRGFTFGAVTPNPSPAPVGNGTIYIFSRDENGFPIENAYIETVTFECGFDQNNGGTKFKETFNLAGGAANIDDIVIAGSGDKKGFQGVSSDDTGAFFQNASFSQATGIDEDLFDFWTLDVDDLTDWTQDLTVFYQATPGDPVEASLKVTGNGRIYQTFADNNVQFPSDRPLIIRVPFIISGVNAGTLLRLRIGEQVKNYTITGAETSWTDALRIDTNDRSWYKAIAKNDGVFAIEVHGMSAGTIWFDNALIAPSINFDGLYYAICAGSIPFKIGDKYSFTHTATDDAIIQRFFVQHTGYYLPPDANSSAITWADPVFHT